MTIKELKQKIENLPDEMKVLVNGYEDGLDEVSSAQVLPIKLNTNDQEWSGPHEIDESSEAKAFLIARSSF